MPDKHDKKDKTFDSVAHEAEVLTWKDARMKAVLDYRIPYRPFMDISESLRQLDDGVCRVVGHEKTNSRTCLCGKNPHTNDCLIHPHLTLKLLDPDDNSRRIPSLWLEPVEFLPTEKVEPAKTEIITEEVTSVEESGGFVEEDDSFTDELQSQEVVVENFLKALSENQRTDLIVVHSDASGKLQVCTIDEFIREGFYFDAKDGVWMFGDAIGVLGKATFLGENHKDGFMIIIEGKVEQICNMTDAVMLSCKAFFREEVRETKDAISTLLESVIERI